MGAQDLLTALEMNTEVRLRVVELPGHPDVLGPLPGEEKRDLRASACSHATARQPWSVRVLAVEGDILQPPAQLACGLGDDRNALLELLAPRVGGVADVFQRDLRV